MLGLVERFVCFTNQYVQGFVFAMTDGQPEAERHFYGFSKISDRLDSIATPSYSFKRLFQSDARHETGEFFSSGAPGDTQWGNLFLNDGGNGCLRRRRMPYTG